MTDKILSVDPGKSTGWAIFSMDSLEPRHSGTHRSVDSMAEWLASMKSASNLHAIVYEGYRVRPYVNHNGSEVEASQVIGMLKLVAKQLNVEIHKQEPSILNIAQRWSPNHRMPKNHQNSHDIAAILHGRYWLINNKHLSIPSVGRLLPGEVL